MRWCASARTSARCRRAAGSIPRGFRPVINEALSSGIPVLTAVNAGNLPDFESYAEGLGERLVPDAQALSDWAGRMTAGAQVANG